MQNLRRKRALEKANVEAKSVLKEMQSLKKGMNDLRVRPHPVNTATCERKSPERFPLSKKKL